MTTNTYQMLEWIEDCEQAAQDGDLPRLGELLTGINGPLDVEFPHRRKSKGSAALCEHHN
jgi:hypothetical protein